MTPVRDVDRFEALYRSTRSDLLAYLVRRCHSAEDAADLLAETYLVAWEKLNRLPAGDQARLWLFGVARNLSRQGIRRSRVGGALVERLAVELRSVTDHEIEPRDETLWAALQGLPADEREVILLTAWEGLAPREIAIVLGTSANAVRIRLHRARRRLRRRLGPDTCSDEQSDPVSADLFAGT